MECDRLGDPENILTPEDMKEVQVTKVLRHPDAPPVLVEKTLVHYADSLERLIAADPVLPASSYSVGFVAGIRAAAKVASNANEH